MNNNVYVIVVFGDIIDFNEDAIGTIVSEVIRTLKISFPWINVEHSDILELYRTNIDDVKLAILSERIYKAIESVVNKLTGKYVLDVVVKQNYFIMSFEAT